MQRFSFAVGGAFLLTGICLTFGGDDAKQDANPKSEKKVTQSSKPDKSDAEVDEKKATDNEATEDKATEKKGADESAQDPMTDEAVSPEEQAIRAEAQDFIQAYCDNDAKRAAAHFTPEAEYVNPHGIILHGRESIEKSLTAFFAAHPGCGAETTIESIRIVSPGVAIEDGITSVLHPEREAVHTHYTALHVKTGDKWLVASVRDQESKQKPSHESELEQLNWLLGDWIDEDADSVVSFSCQPVDKGKFFLRQFSLKIEGEEALSGSQRVGWDPLTGQLLTWTFDSEGGHATGTWYHDGDHWILKSTGVTSDGEAASGSSVYTFVNENTMTWQAVDHVVGGKRLPDSPVFTLVKKLPPPK